MLAWQPRSSRTPSQASQLSLTDVQEFKLQWLVKLHLAKNKEDKWGHTLRLIWILSECFDTMGAVARIHPDTHPAATVQACPCLPACHFSEQRTMSYEL